MPQDKQRFNPWFMSWQKAGFLLCFSIGAVSLGCSQATQPRPAIAETSQVITAPENSPLPNAHHIDTVNGARIHVVTLPEGMEVSVAVADELKPLAEFAQSESAIYAINAGFFDPQNGKTTSHIAVQGEATDDPADNEGLTGNPNLGQYLSQILTHRSEFRAYQCEGAKALSYDIEPHYGRIPEGCTAEYVVGAGPMLLPYDTSFAEAFTDYDNDDPNSGEITRDAIGSMQRNARSAIGIDLGGNAVLFMVEKNENSVGMTLAELTEYARAKTIQKLLNLDGGSSSSLYIGDGDRPAMHFGRADEAGNPIERPIKSAIIVRPLL